MKTMGTVVMLLLLIVAVACTTTSQESKSGTTVGGVQKAPIEQVRDYHNYLEF